jgi:dTDP-4-amino-4,6-dideoxygalactose transaminase
MDPEQMEKMISPRTKAILPVHLYGQCANMDAIMSIARKHNLVVIEDAAQSHGAEHNGKRAGTMGDMACFSFYPGKNLGAYGEGGAVVTNNPDYDKTIRMLRDWGQEKKGFHDIPGFNTRMSGFQGAVLGVKIKYLEAWTEARREKAKFYDAGLSDTAITRPHALPENKHVYHVYAIRTKDRESLKQTLSEAKIAFGVHYPIPAHLQKGYASLGYETGDFPVSETLANETLSLPIYPELTEQNISQITEVIGKS